MTKTDTGYMDWWGCADSHLSCISYLRGFSKFSFCAILGGHGKAATVSTSQRTKVSPQPHNGGITASKWGSRSTSQQQDNCFIHLNGWRSGGVLQSSARSGEEWHVWKSSGAWTLFLELSRSMTSACDIRLNRFIHKFGSMVNMWRLRAGLFF